MKSRQCHCGVIEGKGELIVKDDKLIFLDYNSKKEIVIRENDNDIALMECGWWICDRVKSGESLEKIIERRIS